MTRLATKTSLLLGVAVLALSACGGSSKGPGPLGSKNDIVVRNNGLPGAVAPVPPSAEGEISSTVEQAEAVPAPDVAQAPLEMPPETPAPLADPVIEQEAARIVQEQAPVASPASAPMNDGAITSTSAATDPVQGDVLPQEPVISTPAAPESASVPLEANLDVEPVTTATSVAPVQEISSSSPKASVGTQNVAQYETATDVAPISQGAVQASDNTYVPDDAPAAAIAALNAKRIAENTGVMNEEVQQVITEQPNIASSKSAVSAPETYVQQQVQTASADAPQTQVSPSSVYPAEDYPPEMLTQAAPVPSSSVVVPNEEEGSFIAPPQGTEIVPPVDSSEPVIDFKDPAIIKLAQDAMKRKGIYNGPKDGVVNTQYLNALSKYQAANNLPQGGLNAETFRHLGVLQ
jgi:hypothetical protein